MKKIGADYIDWIRISFILYSLECEIFRLHPDCSDESDESLTEI